MDTIQLMVDNDLLSLSQAEEARRLAGSRGGPALRYVQERDFLSEMETVSFMVRASNLHYIKLNSVELDQDAARQLDPALRRELLALPVRKSRTALAVAMVDPLDRGSIDRIREATAYQVLPFIAGLSEIEKALERVERTEKALRVARVPPPPTPAADAPVLRWGRVDTRHTLRDFVAPDDVKAEIGRAVETLSGSSDKGWLLLIRGEPEAGKSHLINGMLQEIHKNNRKMAMGLFAGRDFAGELFSAMKSGSKKEFQSSLMSLDLLVIDGMEFMEGREKLQRVVLKLLNLMVWRGKSAVLAWRPWLGAAGFEEGLKDYIVNNQEITLAPRAGRDLPAAVEEAARDNHRDAARFRELIESASTRHEVVEVVRRALLERIATMNGHGPEGSVVLGRVARVAQVLEEENLPLALRLWKNLAL